MIISTNSPVVLISPSSLRCFTIKSLIREAHRSSPYLRYDLRQFLFIVSVHYVVRGKRIILVHPHIQRCIMHIGKSPLAVIQLITRKLQYPAAHHRSRRSATALAHPRSDRRCFAPETSYTKETPAAFLLL